MRSNWRPSGRFKGKRLRIISAASLLVAISSSLVSPSPASAAINQIPIPDPKPSSYGLEATKTQPPPDTPPTISTPSSGASFSTSPITVSGVCKDGLLVEVSINNVMVGTVMCKGGSFTIQVSLFIGQNDITAIQYDDLGQASPISNTVTVSYQNASFTAFGTQITLTSNYGRRAANPGSTLKWPLILAGGTGPYAMSIDWGDGSASELRSLQLPGEINISHVFKQAGVYNVTVKVTDVNGISAFLQLVAVANGAPVASASSAGDKKDSGTTTITRVLWIPAAIGGVLLLPTFWLGRRSQLVSLHRKLEKDMESYKEL